MTLEKWHCRPPYLMGLSDFSPKTCLAGEWSNVALPDLPSLLTLCRLWCPRWVPSGFSSKVASTNCHLPMCNLHLRDCFLQFLWKPTGRLWPWSRCIQWMGLRTTGSSYAMSSTSRFQEPIRLKGRWYWWQHMTWAICDCFLLCRVDWRNNLACPGTQSKCTHLVKKESRALIIWQ